MILKPLLFTLLISQAFSQEAKYLTATLLKDCTCTVSHCDMGKCEDKEIPKKKGDVVGKYCLELKKEKDVKCASGKIEYGAFDLLFCPKDCAQTIPTPRLSRLESEKIYEEGVQALKKEYQKVLPPEVYSSLTRERNLWQPIFFLDEVKNYEMKVKPQASFYLEAPIAEEGNLRWYSVVLFHERNPETKILQGWIGVFDKSSGTVVKFQEYPEISGHDPVFEHTPSVLMVPSPELTPYLSIWITGRLQAKQVGFGPIGPKLERPTLYFADALMKLMKEKVPGGQHLKWSEAADPQSTKPVTRWTQISAKIDELKDEVWLTSQKTELFERDDVASKKIGECGKGHLALVLDEKKDAKMKSEWKSAACDSFRGFIHKKNLKGMK